MKTTARARWLAIITALVMMVTMMPGMVWAAEGEEAGVFRLKNAEIDSNQVGIWDCVYLGSYPQSSDGKGGFITEPIKWRVLRLYDTDGDGVDDDAFLMADRNLDARQYHSSLETKVTWENCELRSWLNSDSDDGFYGKAFNETEKEAIKLSKIETGETHVVSTEDKVYLLNTPNMNNTDYGFFNKFYEHDTRKAMSTDYTRSRGGEVTPTGHGKYWLRASGLLGSGNETGYVQADGQFNEYGGVKVNGTDYGIRPALHLDLTKDVWSYAGVVKSDGTVRTALTDVNVYEYLAYTGSKIEPKPVVKCGDTVLEEGKDYNIIAYKNNINVGTATVAVEGIGSYAGILSCEFKIRPANIYEAEIALSPDYFNYTGAANRPVPTITYKGKTLKEEADYTVTRYDNNVKVGRGTVTITGKGNFTAIVTVDFTIGTHSVRSPRISGDVTTWDCVNFGSYKQSSESGRSYVTEPIKWRVLSVDGDDAFLISDKILDSRVYDERRTNPDDSTPEVTWGNSTIRSWLNGYDASGNSCGNDYTEDSFIGTAFTEKEQKAIIAAAVDGGASDNIYMLSADEAMTKKYGFGTDDMHTTTREAKNTAYAASVKGMEYGEGQTDAYWLRSSTGDSDYKKQNVRSNGGIDTNGLPCYYDGIGVRPVLHLNLSSEVWCYAGTVNSEGTEKAGITAVELDSPFYEDTGAAVTPEPVVKSGDTVLTKGTDYTLRYTDNIGIGIASVTATAMGDYTGAVTKAFYIVDNRIANAEITFADGNPIFDGSYQTPEVVVKVSGATLRKDKDYTLDYEDNLNVGTGTVTVTGCGIFKGTKDASFTIEPKNIADAEVVIEPSDELYDGNSHEPDVAVYMNGKVLRPGEARDYTIVYADNTEVGTAKVTITGHNNYTGEVTKEFSIKKNIYKGEAELSATAFIYNGEERKPAVTVTYDDFDLAEGTDYTVEYKNNKSVGTATVTISGIGMFDGKLTKTFKINPKGTALKAPVKLKKGFQAKWAQQSAKMANSRVTGYQVRYSVKKSMAGAKIKTVAGYGKTSVKVTKLKAKKKYYMQVRTYKVVGGRKYFSKWSAKKYVTTK